MTAEWRAAREIPPLRRWSRGEVSLTGLLLTFAASGWILNHLMGAPEIRVGILTGAQRVADVSPASRR